MSIDISLEQSHSDHEEIARKLAHAIANDQLELATTLFRRLAASPIALESNEGILRVRLKKIGRLNALFELFVGGYPGALSRLRLVAKACEIAVELGKPEEGLKLIKSVRESGTIRFGGGDTLGAGLSTILGSEFRKPLAELKYQGLTPISIDETGVTAALLAERLDLDQGLVEQLYTNRVDVSLSRVEWERAFRTAICVGHIVNDRPFTFPGGPSANKFISLVDQDALRRDFEALDDSDGLLVVSWHSGLRPPMTELFKSIFPDSLTVQRPAGDPQKVIRIEPDAGAAMIVAVRAMMDGRVVLMYPDGKHGNRPHSVSVAGKTLKSAAGAALIAYESRCTTVWYTILPSVDSFVYKLVVGPKPNRRESFDEFSVRWLEFYWGEVSAVLTGPPSQIFLGTSWSTLEMWSL